jgi:predicted cobalt transporter CbtA
MSTRVGGLLLRGMVAGLVAGLLAAAFASLISEPSIERAVALEVASAAASGHLREPELVSRSVQKREGLLTAGAVYGAAIGGLFALAFALCHGRLGRQGARETAAALTIAGFVAIVLVPASKYPANPPASGDPDTIGARTALYFFFVLVSLAAMVLAATLYRSSRRRLGRATAGLASTAVAVVLLAAVGFLLPSAEVAGSNIPPDLVSTFRLASLATQAVLWATLGLGFTLALPRQIL